MRINKRLIKAHYGQAIINRNYRLMMEASTRMAEDINRAVIDAIKEGSMCLFENEVGIITTPCIQLDLCEGVIRWNNIKP